MKRYDRYKDSGIEWIGEIPEKWNVKKLKYIANLITNKSSEKPKYILALDNLESWSGRIIGDPRTTKIEGDVNLFTKNDILFNKLRPYLAKVAKAPEDGGCVGELLVLRAKDPVTPEFLFYRLLSEFVITIVDGSTYGTKMPRASWEKFISSIKIPVPHISEQIQITNFIEVKTSKIDTLISKKKKLISLLKEECTAIINKAVTKGINTNVKYKDSGIEWVGQTPEHWKATRIKNIGIVIGRIGFRGYTITDIVSKESGVVSLSPGNIKNHTLDLNSCTYLSREKYHESPEIMVFENDIVLVKTGSTIGKVALIPQGTPEMTLNPQLVVLKNISIENAFLYYLMISKYFQSYFKIYTAGGSTPAISQEKINNFKIVFPNNIEQKKIVTFIEAKTSKIDITIAKIKNEIALIKEYKSALINDVVTGKINVTDAIVQNQDKLQEAHQ